MDQKQLDILNLMARLDQEAPFLNEGVESFSTVEFDSIEDATAAFESTLSMRDSIKTQAVADHIPEAWIERIQNFSDGPSPEPSPSLGSLMGAWLKSIRESVFGQPQYWGAGLVTASVLAIVFTPFGGQLGETVLGDGIQSPALTGGVGGKSVVSASLSTEESQGESPDDALDFHKLTTEREIEGLEGLSVLAEKIDPSAQNCIRAKDEESEGTPEPELPERCLDQVEGGTR